MSRSGPLPLRGAVQAYDWGSTTAIPELLGVAGRRPTPGRAVAGRPPDALRPRPASPGTWLPLDRLVADSPADLLGVGRWSSASGNRLPFLVKLLAAARPLSLQVHPNMAQAREGYAREEAAAVPRRAVYRTYRDRNHKPELLVALTPFDALSGFRPPTEAAELAGELARAGARPLRAWASRLAEGDLYGVFWDLWDLPADQCARLVAAAGQGARRLAGSADGRWRREAAWTARLAAQHPTDPGVVVALLLNLLHLQPGQALYAPAGRLHAYLEGLGARGDGQLGQRDPGRADHQARRPGRARARAAHRRRRRSNRSSALPTGPTGPRSCTRRRRPSSACRASTWSRAAPAASVAVGGRRSSCAWRGWRNSMVSGWAVARPPSCPPPAPATQWPPRAGPAVAPAAAAPAVAAAAAAARRAVTGGPRLWRVGIGSLDQHREPERRRRDRDR